MNTPIFLQRVTNIKLRLIQLSLAKKIVAVAMALMITGLTTGIVYGITFAEENDVQGDDAAAEVRESEKKAITVNPILLKNVNERVVAGTVISNETASVYPRRDGVVQDILVDIGDRVQKNQVIARMLPPGVEGESAGMIAEKRAMVNRGESEVKNAEAVAQATVQTAEQELMQEKIALENLLKNRTAILQQVETVVGTTIDNEAAKIAAAQQALEAVKAQIPQMLEQAELMVVNARKITEQVLFGQEGKRSVLYYSTQNILPSIGSNNPGLSLEIVTELNGLLNAENEFLQLDVEQKKIRVPESLRQASQMLAKTQEIIKLSFPSGDQTPQDLLNMISEVVMVHDGILKSKESVEDAFNDLKVEEEKLRLMESEQRKMVDVSERDLQSAQTMQTSEVENVRAQIMVTEKKLELMKADQQKMVDREKSELGVYRAVLQQEYAKSGNQEIRSPFAGVVSKRMLQVGEMASPAMPAFELVNVPTTLAKKAKREIQFGLPEDLGEVLKVGDIVDFFLPNEEITLAQATVTRKSPQVDPDARVFTVQAKLDDVLVIPHNTRVRVRIHVSDQLVYRISSAAIKREQNANFIWVIPTDSKEPQRLEVTVLNEDGEFAEITGQIDEQTSVLLNSPEPITSDANQPTS